MELERVGGGRASRCGCGKVTMKLSVVITSYNRAALLVHAVASVLEQVGEVEAACEVVVVDDGSTDGSAGTLRAHLGNAKGHPQRGLSVRVIEQINLGPGAARNAGARAALGEYVLFLDGDDMLLPGALGRYLEAIGPSSERDKPGTGGDQQPAIVCGGPLHATHDGADAGFTALRATAGTHSETALRVWPTWLHAYARDNAFLGAGGLCVRRDVLLAVGGFPEHRLNSEDIDTLLRLGAIGPCVSVGSPPVFIYRHIAGSASAANVRTLDGWREIVRRFALGVYAKPLAGSVAAVGLAGAEGHVAELDAVVVSLIARQTRAHARRFLREGDHALAWAMFRLAAPFSWQAGRRAWVVRFPLAWTFRRVLDGIRRGERLARDSA